MCLTFSENLLVFGQIAQPRNCRFCGRFNILGIVNFVVPRCAPQISSVFVFVFLRVLNSVVLGFPLLVCISGYFEICQLGFDNAIGKRIRDLLFSLDDAHLFFFVTYLEGFVFLIFEVPSLNMHVIMGCGARF